MSKNDSILVGWAEGRGKNLAKSKNVTKSWGALKKLLSVPHVTPERRKEFDKMSKDEQDQLKSAAGWISGAQCKDNHRNLKNILPRDLLTIDIDYPYQDILEDITEGHMRISAYEGFWHSSRRHTPDAPRVRFFAPLARKVTVDEYQPLVRMLAHMIDREMKTVDQVSFRPAQMMFKPTCSKDDKPDFFTYEQTGVVIDPDAMLARYEETFGDWRDISTWPKHPDETVRKKADKAEDPRTKRGPVGTFCRAYLIEAAMEQFLEGVYIPGDEHSGHPRYTFAGSTSSNGAVVYDDGLFLYSHHGHDPVCDMNVNAFDLVRLHLFGDLDEKAKEDTLATKMPSYKAMVDHIRDDPGYRKQLAEDKFDTASMFDDIEEEDWTDGTHAGDAGSDSDDEDDADAGDAGDGTDSDLDDGDLGGSGHRGAGKTGHSDDWDDSADGGGLDDAGIEDDIADVVGGGVRGSDGRNRDRAREGSDAGERREGSKARKAAGGAAGAPKRPEKSTPRKRHKEFLTEHIELTPEGEIKVTLPNIATIIMNDARLCNVIWFNEFTKQIVQRRTLDPRVPAASKIVCDDPENGTRWEDINDSTIRTLLETENGTGKAGYGMRVPERDLQDGIMQAAFATRFHPIRDYLLDCEAGWDGEERLDTLLIRYLGVEDIPYHRETVRMMMVASVARIFEPGHKFDYALILQGEQGIRKSSFIKALYSEDWFGELATDLGEKQKVAEEIAGKWGVELPELSGLHKADHNAAKAFMRRQFDDVRMAYDRRVTEFPRQCVCWGSTNDDVYLKDPTGNRSYWPVIVLVSSIDVDALAEERDQLWGEAAALYWKMREEKPKGELPLYLRDPASIAVAQQRQEKARMEEVHEEWTRAITDWLETPVTLQQLLQEIGISSAEFTKRYGFGNDIDPAETMVLRTAFRGEDAVQFALNKQHGVITENGQKLNMNKVWPMIDRLGWRYEQDAGGGKARSRVCGVRGRWRFMPGCTPQERELGYRIVTDAEEDDFDVI